MEYGFNCDSRATDVYRLYYIYIKMEITHWYRNGSSEAFCKFCARNQGKAVSIKLINRSEPVRGELYNYGTYSYGIDPPKAGLSLLLTDRVIHPAYYCLEDIEDLRVGLDQ